MKSKTILKSWVTLCIFVHILCCCLSFASESDVKLPSVSTASEGKNNSDSVELCSTGSRLRVAVQRFKRDITDNQGAQALEQFEDMVMVAMKSSKRFDLVERMGMNALENELSAILQEIRLGQSGLVDEKTKTAQEAELAGRLLEQLKKENITIQQDETSLNQVLNELKIGVSGIDRADALSLQTGKLLAADAMLTGVIKIGGKGIEVSARLVSVATQQTLAEFKGSDGKGDRSVARLMAQDMASKLADAMPIFHANVMDIEANGLLKIAAGIKHGIKSPMLVNILLQEDVVTDPETGAAICIQTKDAGIGIVTKVDENTAEIRAIQRLSDNLSRNKLVVTGR